MDLPVFEDLLVSDTIFNLFDFPSDLFSKTFPYEIFCVRLFENSDSIDDSMTASFSLNLTLDLEFFERLPDLDLPLLRSRPFDFDLDLERDFNF